VEPIQQSEIVELRQFMLGMNPYIVIEGVPDPEDEDELLLKVNAGGLPEGVGLGTLPMMMLSALPAEANPLTITMGELIKDYPEDLGALYRLADAFGFPMPGDEDPS
jgi:hypothetical protein